MTFHEFQKKAESNIPPRIRRGQNLFNVLHDIKPELANSIRGSEIDPFYHDKRIPLFYEWLYLNWE